MFRNSGRKLRVVVKILFWLNLLFILALAGGAVWYVYTQFDMEMTILSGVAAAVVVVVYMVGLYFALLMLNAFAELSQSNVEIRRILGEMRNAQGAPAFRAPVIPVAPAAPVRPREQSVEDWGNLDAPYPQPAPAAPVRPVSEVSTPKQPVWEAPAVPEAAPQESAPKTAPFGMVFCRRCGAKHEPGVAKCRYCGTPLG